MRKSLIYVSVLTGLCFFSSCKDDDNSDDPKPDETSEPLTVEESQSTVLRLSTSLEEDVQDLIDAEGIDQLEFISDLVNSEDNSTMSRGVAAETRKDKAVRIAKGISSNLKTAFSRRSGRFISEFEDDEEFVFEDYTGNWVWDEDLADAEFVSESDVISIKFNSDENDTELSGTFIIRSLDLMTTDDGDLPLDIEVELLVDNEELMSFEFSADYNSNNDPTSLSTSAFIKPLTMTFSYDIDDVTATGSTSYSFNNSLVYSISSTIVFTDNTLEEPSSISGEVVYDGVRIVGDLDVAAVDVETEDEIAEINEALTCDFFTADGNQLIGSVVIEEDPETVGNPDACDPMPFIVYSDGSQDNLLDLAEEAANTLEDYIDNELEELEL